MRVQVRTMTDQSSTVHRFPKWSPKDTRKRKPTKPKQRLSSKLAKSYPIRQRKIWSHILEANPVHERSIHIILESTLRRALSNHFLLLRHIKSIISNRLSRFLHQCIPVSSVILSVDKQTIHHEIFCPLLLIQSSLCSLPGTEKEIFEDIECHV